MPQRRIVLITAPRDGSGGAQQVAILSGSMGFQPVSAGSFTHGLEAHATEEFDLHVLTLSPGASVPSAIEAPTKNIHLRGPYDLAGLWKLRQTLNRLRPALVHTWGPLANRVGRLAALAAGIPRWVATEGIVDPLKSAAGWLVERGLARRASRRVAVSRHVREWLLAGGLSATQVQVIPNGVSISTRNVDRSAIRAELGLRADARLIAAAAPLVPHNRLKDVIWAAELLRFIRDDVHLLVIGDGPQRQTLARYRDLIGVAHHVHFLGWREDAQRLIASCDLLWYGGGHEGQPQAVMEALAAGLPVVAADTPGIRTLMTHGQQGYIVPLGDRAALARFANVLIDDAELRAELGAAGREKMRQEFSPLRMVQSYAALYRELLQ